MSFARWRWGNESVRIYRQPAAVNETDYSAAASGQEMALIVWGQQQLMVLRIPWVGLDWTGQKMNLLLVLKSCEDRVLTEVAGSPWWCRRTR